MPTVITRKTITIDATDRSLGRLASEIAQLLRGKHKPSFAPNVDGGDFVTVTNIEKLKFTGNKLEQKVYFRHSLYPGGLKEKLLKEKFADSPANLLTGTVYGMLPKNKLRQHMLKRLKFVK